MCEITQKFGQNANGAYKAAGLQGHTGIDIACGYGTPVYPIKRLWVYKVLDGVKQVANDGSGFTGVFGLDEDGQEWLYGHCDTLAVEGRWYETGEIIGKEANHGLVFSGGTQITLAMQKAGDTRGAHRHIQKRKCVLGNDPNKIYLTNYGGRMIVFKGQNVQVENWWNGFNGCVNFDVSQKYLSGVIEPISSKIETVSNAVKAVKDPDWAVLAVLARILRFLGL